MVWFYAVAVGRQVGVYQTWEACKQQVDGYSNAKHKKFRTIEEANQFIAENRIVQPAAVPATENSTLQVTVNINFNNQ